MYMYQELRQSNFLLYHFYKQFQRELIVFLENSYR